MPSAFAAVHAILTWIATWAPVQDEISLPVFIDHRRVNTTKPLVGDDAVGVHRVTSSEFDWPEWATRRSSEKCTGNSALSVESEAGNCSEQFSRGMECVTTVQCRIRAICLLLPSPRDRQAA